MTISIPFILACLWLVAANVLAMIPSNDNHWRRAYGLMAFGFPLLIWLWAQHGILLALVFLVAGMSVLRWPVIYLTRWIKRQLGRSQVTFLLMLLSALVAFVLATHWSERGKSGAALTLIALAGASFAVTFYATKGTLGLNPVLAWSWALLFALPATLGACAGALLGWMIRWWRDRRLP